MGRRGDRDQRLGVTGHAAVALAASGLKLRSGLSMLLQRLPSGRQCCPCERCHACWHRALQALALPRPAAALPFPCWLRRRQAAAAQLRRRTFHCFLKRRGGFLFRCCCGCCACTCFCQARRLAGCERRRNGCALRCREATLQPAWRCWRSAATRLQLCLLASSTSAAMQLLEGHGECRCRTGGSIAAPRLLLWLRCELCRRRD